MFEDDDMILPDDFQEDTTPTEEVTETDTQDTDLESVEDTKPTEEVSEPVEEPFLKVKFNKEELALDAERARELAQKGLNYDKVQERLQSLESDPRLSFVEELAKEQGMEVNEYLEAVREAKEQQRLNELLEQNIPEEYAREILENKKFREQLQEERQAKQVEEAQRAEAMDFFDFFKEATGRDYTPGSKEDLPDEVIAIQEEQGIPLKFAYMQYQNKQLQNQIKVLKQNEENAKRAPIGGVSTHGSTEIASEDDFLAGFNSI
jgi:hypothetical protein